MGIQKIVLQQQLAFLLRQAAARKDPEFYAEFLLDQSSDEKVLAFAGQENAIEQLIALNGEVANYRPWFEALRVSILELTAPDAPGENEGRSGVIIPAVAPVGETEETLSTILSDAISDTDNTGDVEGAPIGDGGDTPNP